MLIRNSAGSLANGELSIMIGQTTESSTLRWRSVIC